MVINISKAVYFLISFYLFYIFLDACYLIRLIQTQNTNLWQKATWFNILLLENEQHSGCGTRAEQSTAAPCLTSCVFRFSDKEQELVLRRITQWVFSQTSIHKFAENGAFLLGQCANVQALIMPLSAEGQGKGIKHSWWCDSIILGP